MPKIHPLLPVFLSPEQVEAMLVSEEAFATYLASLSSTQVKSLIESVTAHKMDPAMKKAMLAILRLTLQEALRNEEEIRKLLEPQLENLAECMELAHLIGELQKLQASHSTHG